MLSILFVATVQTTAIAIRDVSIVVPGQPSVVAGQTVVVRGDSIVSVGPVATTPVPSGVQTIDGKGKFLMPGLWDMHVHLDVPRSLSLYTANGVTGIRVMFGNPNQLKWRRDVDSGLLLGPQMVVGSPIVDGPKPVWPTSIAVADAEAARKAVRKIKADGYDFVKVYSLLSRESYFAIADEAKKVGIPFEGHVPHSVGLLEAAAAGQRSSEHLMGLALSASTQEEEIRAKIAAVLPEGLAKAGEVSRGLAADVTATYERAKWDRVVAGLATGGMWQCATLVVQRSMAHLDVPEFLKDERLKYVNPFVSMGWDPKKDFRLQARTPEDWKAAKAQYAEFLRSFGILHKAGVPMLAGTDTLNPYTFAGFSLHDELGLMVEAGMTPTEAIASATTGPARYLGLSKTHGTVEVGKQANLVLLTADPMQAIANTKRIEAVIQRGRLFDKAALAKVLKEAEYSGGR